MPFSTGQKYSLLEKTRLILGYRRARLANLIPKTSELWPFAFVPCGSLFLCFIKFKIFALNLDFISFSSKSPSFSWLLVFPVAVFVIAAELSPSLIVVEIDIWIRVPTHEHLIRCCCIDLVSWCIPAYICSDFVGNSMSTFLFQDFCTMCSWCIAYSLHRTSSTFFLSLRVPNPWAHTTFSYPTSNHSFHVTQHNGVPFIVLTILVMVI